MEKNIRKYDPGIINILSEYSFPGNIRELKNIIERAVIMCDGDTILPNHISFSALGSPGSNERISDNDNVQQAISDNFDLEFHEKRLIQNALIRANNNKSKAATLLNVTWQALDRRMKKHGLD
jgi:transcriptional regulator with PAS, ATPase and Fis domain